MEEVPASEVSSSVTDETNVAADGDGANKEKSNDVVISEVPSEGRQNADDSSIEPNQDPFKALENIVPATIPDKFTSEEQEYFQKIQRNGNVGVQFQRIHCTACNEHLGSAPINQKNRYIHPLLKVLVCKRCYDFYCSGEFDKDEDGSELYCRWCGEGGNVLCCAQCPYVFCKKCIRTNLGRRKLEAVKESDDWLCFVCVPSQLVNHRINCRALFEFVQNEIKYAKSTNNPQLLMTDHSMCCQKKPQKPPQVKRKRVSTEDMPYDPFLDSVMEDPKRRKVIVNNYKQKVKQDNKNTKQVNGVPDIAWTSQEEDEVVCTPDLTLFMNDEEEPDVVENGVSESGSDVQVVNEPPPPIIRPPLPPPVLNRFFAITQPPPLIRKPGVLPKPILPKLPNNLTPTTISTPAIKLTNSVTGDGQSVITVTHNLKKTNVSTRLMPGLKHEWFDRAMQLSARVNQNLSTRLATLSEDQSCASTLEELAHVHNRLQEVLSSSINSLIQIRKNLRNEFLNGLNYLKFTTGPPPPKNPVPVDDDDVILVEGNDEKPNNEPLKDSASPVVQKNENPPGGCYIKVKPISKLINPEGPIEIMDDVITEPSIGMKEDEVKNQSVQEGTKAEGNKEQQKQQQQQQLQANEELPELDENLNPEVISQIKQAIELSKREKMLHDTLNVKNIPTEELKKMLSVKVIVKRENLEALLAVRRAKILEKKAKVAAAAAAAVVALTPPVIKKPRQDLEDIEQLLETSIVPKKVGGESSSDSDSEESDNEGEEECAWDSDTEEGVTEKKEEGTSKNEESSGDPHTVDSGIDVECDRAQSKKEPEGGLPSDCREEDASLTSSGDDDEDEEEDEEEDEGEEDKDEDKDTDLQQVPFTSEVECDA